ncbi:MAG: hypothetical protein U9N86_12340 [Bacteroidota bacterium]|nr:hypothetical protein [Bacteroidota bacterium]
MNSVVRKIVLQLIVVLMVALMGMMIGNRIMFLHVHILPDGTQVHHAHPFDKSTENSPSSQHHHTGSELIVLSALQLLFLFAVIAVILNSVKGGFLRISSRSILTIQPHSLSFMGRAPPSHFQCS